MTILVTGSAGSLGSEIVKQLKDNQTDFNSVYGLDINPGEHVDFICDLVDQPEKLKEIFEDIQPDIIVHCAANIYGIGGFNALPATILGKDVAMLYNTLNLFKNLPKKTKFIYISSSMVYEQVRGDPELSEHLVDDSIAPKTEYGMSKFVGERLVKAFGKEYGIEYTIWRPFNIITPYEKPKEGRNRQGYSHVFADFFENILINKLNPLPIIGSGSQVRCFTWYEEVADCIVSNLWNKKTVNEVYNIGNNEPVNMMQLAHMIVDESKERGYLSKDFRLEFKSVKDYPNDVMVRVPNVFKALGDLGFSASIKTKESIKRCMNEWEKLL